MNMNFNQGMEPLIMQELKYKLREVNNFRMLAIIKLLIQTFILPLLFTNSCGSYIKTFFILFIVNDILTIIFSSQILYYYTKLDSIVHGNYQAELLELADQQQLMEQNKKKLYWCNKGYESQKIFSASMVLFLLFLGVKPQVKCDPQTNKVTMEVLVRTFSIFVMFAGLFSLQYIMGFFFYLICWPILCFQKHVDNLDLNVNFEQLSTKHLKEEIYAPENTKSEKDCIICQMGITSGEKFLRLKCCPKIFYHKPCLDQWFNTKKECTICRRQIDEFYFQDFYGE